MKRSMPMYVFLMALLVSLLVAGCGYTTHSLLPPNFKSIYVDNFTNSIKISAEQTDQRMYRGYRPGMETELTTAVKNKFLWDGNLKLAPQSSADLVLSGSLMDYRREPLRYDDNMNIQEYRVVLIINIKLEDVKAGKVVWEEKGFAGETTYNTGGQFTLDQNAAITKAVVDLARRIVERTVEAW